VPDDSKHAATTSDLSPARRRGRRAAQAIYYGMVAAIAVAATYQITQQVFFAATPSEPAPFRSCSEGIGKLYQAVQQGRRAADERVQQDADHEAALERYRAALWPTWQHRDRLAELCRGDRLAPAFTALERLRYSEEHGVRTNAAELTGLRAKVRGMLAELEPPVAAADATPR
jgi:hypothetical protein